MKPRVPVLLLLVAALSLVVSGCYYATDCCHHHHNKRTPRFLPTSHPSHVPPRVEPKTPRRPMFNRSVKTAELGPTSTAARDEEKGRRRLFGGQSPVYYRGPIYPSHVTHPVYVTVPPAYRVPQYVAPYQTPRAPEQPASPGRVPDFGKAPRGEVKTGGFACSNCGRVTVGKEWATEWVDGSPVTFCCRHCWDSMSALQRRACYENWTRRNQARALK